MIQTVHGKPPPISDQYTTQKLQSQTQIQAQTQTQIPVSQPDLVSTLKLEPKKGAEPPPLYPPRKGMPPKRPEPDQQDLYLIQKTTELRQRFRYSPYFLQFSPPKKEIEKYSDRLFQQQTQSESVPKLFELLKGKPYPEELLCGPQKSVLTRSSKISTTDAENINFEDLEKKEASYKESEMPEQFEQLAEPEEEFDEYDDEFEEYKGNLFDDDDEGVGSEGEGKEEPLM